MAKCKALTESAVKVLKVLFTEPTSLLQRPHTHPRTVPLVGSQMSEIGAKLHFPKF